MYVFMQNGIADFNYAILGLHLLYDYIQLFCGFFVNLK